MALTKITTGIIADGAITSDHLASGAVTHSSLSGITTDNITEGSTNLYYADSLVGTYISGNRDYGNITTTGYIAGPATFTIDPAAVGDNTGTVVIAGNLQVDGTTTTINSTTMEVDDLNITLASGAANAAAANGAGITVDGASATITYDGTNDTWSFNKGINVTGSVLLGTTDADLGYTNGDTGVVFSPNGFIQASRDSEFATLYLNKLNNDGSILNFAKDGLTIGSISVESSGLLVGSGNVGIRFIDSGQERIIPRKTTLSNADALIDLGDSASRFRDLYLSGTISSGNVSIGTTSSSAKLHIQPANSDTLENAIFTRQNNAAGTDGNSFVLRNDAANNFVEMNSGGTNNGGYKFYRGNFSSDPALTIVGSGATGGFVGIGTDDPTEILQLEGNTVAGGNNYIHIRKTDQGAGQGIFIGQPTNDNNLVISNKANNDIVFKTQSDEIERMRIDNTGIKLPHDHFYSQEISYNGHNAWPTSYSASSAYTYSDNNNAYAYGPTGEKLVANVTARAFTNYIHLKTNLIANNIMFYVRTKGYFYSYGVEEILMGGYTYNNTLVLNKSFETIAGGTHNGGNNDLYRASSGSNLIIKIQLGHTDYTEGQMVVLFHSHGMDSSVMRDFRIIEVKTQNDGTNPY